MQRRGFLGVLSAMFCRAFIKPVDKLPEECHMGGYLVDPLTEQLLEREPAMIVYGWNGREGKIVSTVGEIPRGSVVYLEEIDGDWVIAAVGA